MIKAYIIVWGVLGSIWLPQTSSAIASSPEEMWLENGWQHVYEQHYQQALHTWQEGIDRQPDDRLFLVLGAYADFSNALNQLKRIGEKNKAFIAQKLRQNKRLFYVLSARKASQRREVRNKELTDLMQAADLDPPLLANMALKFKSKQTHREISQASAEDIHQKAVALARQGKYKLALEMLAPYAEKPEQFPEIAIDTMVILNWNNQYDDAVRAFEHRPADLKLPDYLKLAIADSYYHLNRFDQALALYSDIPEHAPEFAKAIHGKLQTLIALRRFNDAWNLLPQMSHVPAVTRIFLAMATMHLDEGFTTWLQQLTADADSTAIVEAIRHQLAKLSTQQHKYITDRLKKLASTHDTKNELRYLTWLSWLDDPRDQQLVPDAAAMATLYTSEQLSHIGWVLYRARRYVQAEQVFQAAHMQSPRLFKADMGLAYSHLQNGHVIEAEKILQDWHKTQADNAQFLYALAFLREKQEDFWGAIQAYERILAQYPHDKVARKLQIKALASLGATSQALEEARLYLPDDKAFHDSLTDRLAVDRLHWDEAPIALRILKPLLKKQFREARFDHIPALISNDQATDAVRAYEQLLAEGIKPPLWLQQIAAGAYLAAEQRETALRLYNKVLKDWPRSFDSRIGKFYCLVELQRWEEADEVLRDLENEHLPWSFGRFPYERLNPQKMTVAMARALWLTGQQRYPEAEDYLQKLHASAPGNIEIREALASLHQQRGWPRRSLREYKIIAALQARDVVPPSTLGLSEALNETEFKKQARHLLRTEQKRHPRDPQVIRLQRHYLIETMRSVEIGGHYENSSDGAQDRLGYARYLHPLGLHTDLFIETMFRRSSQGTLSAAFDRIGIGFDHRFNAQWRLRETLSGDYVRQGDIGLRSELNWHPDDFWQVDMFYDSFVSDVPLRARIFNITSDQFGGSLLYRWSEWREASASAGLSRYSDGNQRLEGSIQYSQNILTRYDWRLLASGNFYASRSSLANRPYFSPDRDASVTITLMIEHYLWHRYEHVSEKYERWFTHRLYLTAGSYWQHGFGSGLISALHYEQDIAFSDTHHLVWGIDWGRRPYDGAQVGSYAIDGHYRWDF